MSVTFSLAQVNALRLEASRAATIVDDGPEGWSKSEVDPGKLLSVFTALRLKPGHVLRAYQYRSALGNGNGIIWAMPEHLPFPEPAECQRLEGRFLQPPRPPGALDDYMDAIVGDGTPWSYLSASLFAREAEEFGALWHGCSWSDHSILGADPWSSPGERRAGLTGEVKEIGDRIAALTLIQGAELARYLREVRMLEPTVCAAGPWLTAKPEVWDPSVLIGPSLVSVLFHTFSRLGRERIVRHCDTFRPGQCTFRSQGEVIAVGGLGYVH